MNRITTTLLQATTRSAFWYGLVALIFPVLALLAAGILYLYKSGWLIQGLLIWLLISGIAFLCFMAMPGITLLRSTAKTASQTEVAGEQRETPSEWSQNDLPQFLTEKSDWTEKDLQIWSASLPLIEELLVDNPDWRTLPDRSLTLLATLATWYDNADTGKEPLPLLKRAEYRFTIPDALLVMSIACARYRLLTINHFPFVDQVTVRTMLSWYERKNDIHQGWIWTNRARRILRLANPVAAILGEAREQLTGTLFNHFSNSVQKDLKSLLLQEVVQVGMDLYSGRLKHSPEELLQYRSQALTEDHDRLATPAEPLRILLLGQSNAGKSSLINGLLGELAAETDGLSSTTALQTHKQTGSDNQVRHLIDTPGIEDHTESLETLTQEAAECDLIAWLCRANQPARQPDRLLHDAIIRWFSEHPERRPPRIILVMTHIDQLPPRAEWSPPYDLNKPDRKAQAIRQALVRTREDIGLPAETPAVPACLLTGKLYNLEAVEDQLQGAGDAATLTQFNRRRQELNEQGSAWADRWHQARRLGRVLGGVTLRATSAALPRSKEPDSD